LFEKALDRRRTSGAAGAEDKDVKAGAGDINSELDGVRGARLPDDVRHDRQLGSGLKGKARRVARAAKLGWRQFLNNDERLR
jgi:hypothetical protein